MLNKQQKGELRRKAPLLKPVVTLGAHGLSSAVNAEINRALMDHELIKIRIQGQNRVERQRLIQEICTVQQAELIYTIGHTLVIFRQCNAAITE